MRLLDIDLIAVTTHKTLYTFMRCSLRKQIFTKLRYSKIIAKNNYLEERIVFNPKNRKKTYIFLTILFYP